MKTLEEKKSAIPRASSAESVGVDSKEVQAFIDECKNDGIELHSIMVVRHGKVACEAFKEPYSPTIPHMMYSVSKSFTSTAIGFAIDEGYMSLETKFLDVFPELRPTKFDQYLDKLNVFDLLTMQGGKSVSPMVDRTKDTWLQDFVNSPWAFEPGTEFLYISENMYVLCAMIHRLTGMSVTEFLTPRLYEPLGIDVPYWETCPRGIEAGGWGLFLKTEDLAKFALCYSQHGMYDGKQVIPEWWTVDATKGIADNSPKSDGDQDGMNGYGYCFWRNGGYEKSYRADGMFSQFGIVFEDLDAVVAITGGNIDEQQARSAVWNHFPKAFNDEITDGDGVQIKIEPYAKMEKSERSPLEEEISGRSLVFGKAHVLTVIGMPVSVLPLASVFMEKDKAGNISNVRFHFHENDMTMTWSEGDERNTISVGLDGEYRYDSAVLGGISYTTAATAAWTSENTLEVQIRPVETIAERHLVFTFKDGGKVTMEPSTLPPSSVMLDNIKTSVKHIIASESVAEIASKAISLANPFADPTHYGSIK